MDNELEVRLAELFDTSSPFYTKPWPEIVVKALEVMYHHAEAFLDQKKGPKIIRCRAQPFEFWLNLSLNPLEFDGEQYSAGELAFHRNGRKIAWLNFFTGPQAQLTVLIEGAAAMTDTHRRESGRRLENEIAEALKAEASRLATQQFAYGSTTRPLVRHCH